MGLGLAVRSPWGSGKMRSSGEAKTAILFSVGLGEGRLGLLTPRSTQTPGVLPAFLAYRPSAISRKLQELNPLRNPESRNELATQVWSEKSGLNRLNSHSFLVYL